MKRKKKSLRKKTPAPLRVHVLTDGPGNLARHTLTAIAGQFPSERLEFTFHVFQDSTDSITETIQQCPSKQTIILHAFVEKHAKAMVRKACKLKGISHFDMTGPLVHFLADHSGVAPANELSRLHNVDENYFRRIDAIEYTALHDDGLGLPNLLKADIVLVGISRVSKSPTSIWLATQGYKTANVPIVGEMKFPPELYRVRGKVVALTMQPKRLQEVRRVRMMGSDMEDTEYYDLRSVIKEVMAAETEYRKRGYTVIDVTSMTIEQTAATVLKSLKLSPGL